MIEVRTRQCCIYAHYVGERLIYIGSGTLHRVFNVRDRSPEWKDLIVDGYQVLILAWFEDVKSARKHETALIKHFNPICNRLHTDSYISPHIGNTWNIGRKMSDNSKTKLSQSQRLSWQRTKRLTGRRRPTKPIQCLDTGIIYDGLREAARQTGAHFTSISQCINGSKKTAGGLRFIRLES